MVARYPIHTAKAVETILWLANARPGIDLYHIVKAVYFADKQHVMDYGRPIFGEDYQAERYGPIGATVYGLLTGNPLEQLALGNNGPLPWKIGPRWTITADREFNPRMLSQSDVNALSQALQIVADMTFQELADTTHNDPAYQNANGGRMRYEDMLDRDNPKYEAMAENIQDSSRYAAF